MNVSISEIIVILLIALLVIKPEQLPEVAFTLGRFFQSIRNMLAKMKDELKGFSEVIDKRSEQKSEQQ